MHLKKRVFFLDFGPLFGRLTEKCRVFFKKVEEEENMQNMTTRDLIEQEQKYGLLFLCRKGSMLST